MRAMPRPSCPHDQAQVHPRRSSQAHTLRPADLLEARGSQPSGDLANASTSQHNQRQSVSTHRNSPLRKHHTPTLFSAILLLCNHSRYDNRSHHYPSWAGGTDDPVSQRTHRPPPPAKRLRTPEPSGKNRQPQRFSARARRCALEAHGRSPSLERATTSLTAPKTRRSEAEAKNTAKIQLVGAAYLVGAVGLGDLDRDVLLLAADLE